MPSRRQAALSCVLPSRPQPLARSVRRAAPGVFVRPLRRMDRPPDIDSLRRDSGLVLLGRPSPGQDILGCRPFLAKGFGVTAVSKRDGNRNLGQCPRPECTSLAGVLHASQLHGFDPLERKCSPAFADSSTGYR